MEKKTFWQRLRLTDNKMAYGILIGIGMGLAMGVALDNWASGVAVGVGVGTALGAGWSQQAKHGDKEK
jgi:hypothetical protein